MKISIIVPVYNVSEYLAKCLDSLVSQSFKNIEIIVVNDGSTDNSEEIVKEYIINTYKVLLERGIKGCYIYACDESMQEYLKKYVENYSI